MVMRLLSLAMTTAPISAARRSTETASNGMMKSEKMESDTLAAFVTVSLGSSSLGNYQ